MKRLDGSSKGWTWVCRAGDAIGLFRRCLNWSEASPSLGFFAFHVSAEKPQAAVKRPRLQLSTEAWDLYHFHSFIISVTDSPGIFWSLNFFSFLFFSLTYLLGPSLCLFFADRHTLAVFHQEMLFAAVEPGLFWIHFSRFLVKLLPKVAFSSHRAGCIQ